MHHLMPASQRQPTPLPCMRLNERRRRSPLQPPCSKRLESRLPLCCCLGVAAGGCDCALRLLSLRHLVGMAPAGRRLPPSNHCSGCLRCGGATVLACRLCWRAGAAAAQVGLRRRFRRRSHGRPGQLWCCPRQQNSPCCINCSCPAAAVSSASGNTCTGLLQAACRWSGWRRRRRQRHSLQGAAAAAGWCGLCSVRPIQSAGARLPPHCAASRGAVTRGWRPQTIGQAPGPEGESTKRAAQGASCSRVGC